MPRNKIQSEQIRAESREKILATALQLFAEQGYDGCNVSDIARQAGMSQGNLYWYFSSKKEIYKAVLVNGFTQLGSMMAEAADVTGTAIEKFDFFLERFVAMTREKSGRQFVNLNVNLIAQGGASRFTEFGLSTNEIGAGYHQSLNAIFSQGQNEGSVMPETDPDLLSTFFFAFINGLMIMYPDRWPDLPYPLIRTGALRLVGMDASK